jgi:2,5-diketo-D-gluconate reductase B
METENANNGGIPALGLGTWDLRGNDCVRAVRDAIEIGYRHIDTAEMYENEKDVGRGVRESGAPRGGLFVTTKLWTDHLTRSAVPRSLEASLKRLGMDYVDLLLIHWPSASVPLAETLGAMERLRQSGKVLRIGVSNFPASMWREALELAPVNVNQVELHPYLDQRALLTFAGARALPLVAYTPIAKGRVAKDPTILDVARAHERSPAQVTLRWLIQHPRVAAIPKASRRSHLEENFRIFDFELDESEMGALSSLASDLRLVDPGWSPDWSAG